MRLSNNDYLNTAYYMNMDESNYEIPVDDIPENWFDTPEISTWLASRDFPFDTVENMLSYLKAKFDYSVNFRLIDEEFPQSYAHWWCYCRISVIQNKDAIATYPKLQKWSNIIRSVNKIDDVDISPYKIFGTIENWLDMLTFDILLFTDENQRENIPRIDENNNIILNHTNKTLQNRKKTIQYIINEGASIFNERGWKDGHKYWLTKCKKYNI